jgi:hypothetical protein
MDSEEDYGSVSCAKEEGQAQSEEGAGKKGEINNKRGWHGQVSASHSR